MEGTKALFLENLCRGAGQAFVRFDYSGHGASEGAFEDGTIGAWKNDALAVLDRLTEGPVVIAGSSLGGWISLLLAQERPERVKGITGIAAAPDFTRQIAALLTPAQREQMKTDGFIEVPSAYDPRPYVFTRRLIEEGEAHCLLDKKTHIAAPVMLLQGMQDPDVPWQTAFRIKTALQGGSVRIFLSETGDHRLSRPEDLEKIGDMVGELSAAAADGE